MGRKTNKTKTRRQMFGLWKKGRDEERVISFEEITKDEEQKTKSKGNIKSKEKHI